MIVPTVQLLIEASLSHPQWSAVSPWFYAQYARILPYFHTCIHTYIHTSPHKCIYTYAYICTCSQRYKFCPVWSIHISTLNFLGVLHRLAEECFTRMAWLKLTDCFEQFLVNNRTERLIKNAIYRLFRK